MTSGDPADRTDAPGPYADLSRAPRPRARGAHRAPEPRPEPAARPEPAGPAWIVVPLRAIAFVIVLPFRLLYDLFRLIFKGLGWVFGGIWNALYKWILAPIGRAVATTLYYLLVVPARWIYRVLLTPLGHGIVAVLRWIGWLLNLVLVKPVVWLLNVLIAIPAVFLWKYVLYPVLAWIGRMFTAIGRGIAWVWNSLVVPPWRYAARFVQWLFRTFVAIPCKWLWTYVLRPVGRGIGAVWNVVVGVPYRAVRQALRDVRLSLRRMFRGV
ncbi:hypothetical protein BJF79_36800 [Actinomadura sp. CNU-125]|uniref:hypothetical protein n=1 Tax=Actinomadura sp. CNU-125 TaxID=1904961 RepID=UPI0009660223|nr:hypothetical protein [Actinomadura sp. CNU-125]OLT31569.1 hypothetical protein BJF79_36800 [Actinomadura sp. CNU-125]